MLCISGLDDIGYREIYETYMHSDQIAYIGKLYQLFGWFKFFVITSTYLNLGEFVIFYDITSLQRRDSLQNILMYNHLNQRKNYGN